MPFDYKFHPQAQREYEESVDWYLNHSKKAAINFVVEMDRALELICSNPELWPCSYNRFHEYNLKDYPFTIIYLIEAKLEYVIIFSVHHQKRNPAAKYRI